jgi:hypothetical protein
MKKLLTLFVLATTLFAVSCSEDDKGTYRRGVSFADDSVNITGDSTPVRVLFNNGAPANGFVTISYTTENVAYGTDFTTDVAAESGTFTLPFNKEDYSVQFNFNKLTNAIEGEIKNVVFRIDQISLAEVEITGNVSTRLNFNEMASTGGQASPILGGSNQTNQAYFDLSSGQYTTSPRTAWDLGFYSGADFRVVINGSLGMAVSALNTTNIDLVQTANPSVATGTFSPSNVIYIDNPSGALSGTAIAEVSATEANNKVYLVNLGYSVPTVPAGNGSVNVAGPGRGWKKIRVLRNANGYTLQYADLAATTHSEVTITKDEAYNFTFFSLITGTSVQAEPQKANWDLNFTTFTNIIEGAGSYFFSDFVITNSKGGVTAYQAQSADVSYANFTRANVNETLLDPNVFHDQRIIGANWRNVIPVQLYTDRFYIVKDPAGNIYKLRFTALLSSQGERGNPTFEYALLQ